MVYASNYYFVNRLGLYFVGQILLLSIMKIISSGKKCNKWISNDNLQRNKLAVD